MDIHVTNKTSKSWEVVYVITKVRQLFSKHGVSCFDDLVEGGTNSKNVVIGCRLAGFSMVGLAETVEVLVCCVWRRIVDIHDSRMSILLRIISVLRCRFALLMYYYRLRVLVTYA